MNYDGMVRAQILQRNRMGLRRKPGLARLLFLFGELRFFRVCVCLQRRSVQHVIPWALRFVFDGGVFPWGVMIQVVPRLVVSTVLFDNAAVDIECMARKPVCLISFAKFTITAVVDLVAVVLSPYSVVVFSYPCFHHAHQACSLFKFDLATCLAS